MGSEQKRIVKNSIGRCMFVVISLFVQVGWFVLWILELNQYSAEISLLCSLLALVVVLGIYGRHMNAAFKIPWMILIMVFPVLGLCLYFLIGHSRANRRMRKYFEKIEQTSKGLLVQDKNIIAQLEKEDFSVANQARYLAEYGKYPVYQNTDAVFYDDASKGLEAQKEALWQAKDFIFMEYHAIEDSKAFAGLREILRKKAAEGVEVRIIYDDIGSVGFINTGFIRQMEKEGIKCRVFNPMLPIVNVFMNNRDHRKIMVIDGKIGFTGGYNLADEYFNLTHPYGWWKDTGIRLQGDAVRSFTVMFLEMWNAIRQSDKSYDRYLKKSVYRGNEQGYIQPYADSPLDNENVGENVYMNLLKHAKHKIYFTTPYLIISDEMSRELCLAAKRGVDVRIITPGIPDKKLVFKVTRSYYAPLVAAGVKIFEYTPGFIHAKQCVCDGELAAIGTINMDYRSLYFHFENGVLLYKTDAIQAIQRDFEETFLQSEEVTKKYRYQNSTVLRIGQCLLRLLAPLL
ncbi:MAG: cardiolipin synthase [Lachnospiraceae bacterium]|nr:cardiolipin synthase [Lachnospiraceae bacterium]